MRELHIDTMRDSKQQASVARTWDKSKRNLHAEDRTPGYIFVPFSIESCGRLGDEADKLLTDLTTEASSTRAWKRDVFLHWSR